jgi:glycosyltransferase involved in cell wall biosynthesis
LDRFRNDRESKRESFRRQYGLNPEDVAVGIIGRLVPVKQHNLFLKAYALALKKHHQEGRNGRLVALIIGDGESRKQVEQDCIEAGLTFASAHDDQPVDQAPDASVLFTSWIKDVDRAFAGLDIIALSSLNEGTPVSLIEALAAGKPLVSTDVGGIRDILPTSFHPCLVEKSDVEGFASCLDQLIANSTLREALGKEGERDVFDRFGYQRLVSDMAQLYRKLLQ